MFLNNRKLVKKVAMFLAIAMVVTMLAGAIIPYLT